MCLVLPGSRGVRHLVSHFRCALFEMTSSSLVSANQIKLTTKGDPMPLVRIDPLEGKTPEYGVQVGQIVDRALTDL